MSFGLRMLLPLGGRITGDCCWIGWEFKKKAKRRSRLSVQEERMSSGMVTPGPDVAARLESVPKQKINWKHVSMNWELYLLVLLPLVWLLIFMYVPMYGNIIAFKKFVPNLGIMKSPWVGVANFTRFFRSYKFANILANTLVINVYQLLVGFPVPIVLALLIHYCPFPRYKRTVQMITYAPHFISVVVMVGIIFKLLAPRIGIVNMLLAKASIPEVNFLGSALWFRHVYVLTGVWQNMGWGTIIYLAALSGIDPQLHESAKVDGANIWRRMWHIDIPGIAPTVIILLILRTGQMLNVGFEKVFLMQNNLNISTSEVIQTYVYKIGIASALPQFSYAAAIGLFQNAISFALLLIVNRTARKLSETSLW
jgi:putative aldouronate transport system permease protein